MTSQQIALAVAQMQTKRGPEWTVRQMSNGKWHHVYDARREWSDEASCRTDYRFHREWRGL